MKITVPIPGGATDYTLYKFSNDRAEYIGPVHSDLAKDVIIVQTATPKKTAKSYGNRRSSIRLVRTVEVAQPDGVKAMVDIPVRVEVSLPVGAAHDAFAAQVTELLGTVTASVIQQLFVTGRVN